MRIAELCTLAEVEGLRAAWHELALASAHDTPYVLPEFLLPWLRRLDGRVECRLLAAWDGPTLLGLAPFVRRRIRRFGITLLALRGFPEAAPTPPCDILVRPGAEGVVEAFLTHWLGQRDWDALELPTVPADSPSVGRLVELARSAGLQASAKPVLQTYVVPIEGSWQAYHASRTKKTRQNLRRGWSHFERLGATELASYPGAMGRDEAMAGLDQVLAYSWKDHEQGVQGWNAFLRDLIDELDRARMLRLTFLRLDGRAVAYLLDVPFKNAWYAIHNAYDMRHPSGNAGQLMLAHAIEDAHRRGATRYDFTGDKDYLRRWTHSTRSFVQVRVHRGERLAGLKLRLYDQVHAWRSRQVASGTERDKDAKKAGFRDAEGDPL